MVGGGGGGLQLPRLSSARVSCALTAPISPIASALRRHCVVIASSLRRHCVVIASALRRHCAVIASALRRHCVVIASALRRHCVVIASSLRRHCVVIAGGGSRIPSLRHDDDVLPPGPPSRACVRRSATGEREGRGGGRETVDAQVRHWCRSGAAVADPAVRPSSAVTDTVVAGPAIAHSAPAVDDPDRAHPGRTSQAGSDPAGPACPGDGAFLRQPRRCAVDTALRLPPCQERPATRAVPVGPGFSAAVAGRRRGGGGLHFELFMDSQVCRFACISSQFFRLVQICSFECLSFIFLLLVGFHLLFNQIFHCFIRFGETVHCHFFLAIYIKNRDQCILPSK